MVIPPNTPPQLAQQLWQAARQQALQNLASNAVEVGYTVVNALLESVRHASEFRTSGRFSGARNVKGEVQLAGTDTDTGWKQVAVHLTGLTHAAERY